MTIQSNRIVYIHGTAPSLIIAPHGGGPTDIHTAKISQIIAELTNSFAVINTGWIRPWNGFVEGTNNPVNTGFNIQEGFANLNDLDHCRKSPLYQEFIIPIDDCRKFILDNHKKVHIFIIHGMDDNIRDYGGIDVIVGYGNGNPPRLTCNTNFKDRFISCLNIEQFKPSQGKAGGRLSGWDSKNLNQLYTNIPEVDSVQVEIALSLRNSIEKAVQTAKRLANAISLTLQNTNIPILTNIPER